MRITRLRGARTHNLEGVDLDLHPGTLVVVAGPSGAGKSSLAFETLHAEGQRRYVESFSAYARQFLERSARPDVDELDPVPVSIAVDRSAPIRTSRSTVGTMSEINDYVKSLYAYAATLRCPGCGSEVARDDANAAAAQVLREAPSERVVVTYPVEVDDAESYLGVRETLLSSGYRRLYVGGQSRDLDELAPSDALAEGSGAVHVVADRLVADASSRERLVEAFEAALARGGGRADVFRADARGAGARMAFSRGLHCAACDRAFGAPTPGLFSFNSPVGACPTCHGFGRTQGVDWKKVLPDDSLTLAQGAVRAYAGPSCEWERRDLAKHAKRAGVPMDVPLRELTDAQRTWLVEGDGTTRKGAWYGLAGWFRYKESRAYKMHVRVFLARYRSYDVCTACDGTRLRPEASWWRLGGRTVAELCALPVSEARALLSAHADAFAPDRAARTLHAETLARLSTLLEVGLSYLTLDRQARTLSFGEAQRVSMATALSASLNGALFVLDEPTVGLHPSDVARLMPAVRRLASGDNVAVVVEHDVAALRAADRVVELGPEAGAGGGRVVFDGTPLGLERASTLTGAAMRGEIIAARAPLAPAQEHIELYGATGHNLRGDLLRIPLGRLTCVSGPSGSGKSSLVFGTLAPLLERARGGTPDDEPLPAERLVLPRPVEHVIAVDQGALGRTARGNPATYLGVWDALRKALADTPLARARGYKAGFFSFNVAGGRCEVCRGEGAETVEMQFLSDVTFSCATCQGRRFAGPVLDVRYRDHNVAELLDLTVTEALAHYGDLKAVRKGLDPLAQLGLGYLRLGQSLATLSGGEAQRIKLAAALSSAGPSALILMDEPSAGLHAADLAPLLATLDGLVRTGATVVLVEHDMALVAHADHVVDLGPGAGAEGGAIVAAGTPVEVARSRGPSAPFLRAMLEASAGPESRRGATTSPSARAPGVPSTGAESPHAETTGLGAPIEIRGAREHNLKNLTVRIPREQLVVVTGPSGSGKSSLAFDVLFAEGQRRYLETLAPYARQYMPQLPRPQVDLVVDVPPSISLEQRKTRGGAQSTVGTLTEVAHHLRVLWARAGTLYCPDCQVPIEASSVEAMLHTLTRSVEEVAATPSAEAVVLLAPVVRGRKGHHRELLERHRAHGFTYAWIDGERVALTPGLALARHREHDVQVEITSVPLPKGRRSSVRTDWHDALRVALVRALEVGEGAALAVLGPRTLSLSSARTCGRCGVGYPELDPRFFSFNTRQGQCEACEGAGEVTREVGRGKAKRTVSTPCAACAGSRLNPLPRAVRFADRRIHDVFSLSVDGACRVLDAIAAASLDERSAAIAQVPLEEARRRLGFLSRVGLGYLGLDRPASTLSGGELQRVRLAAQLGSGLTGVLYVLDEPTIGLHPRDTGKLIDALAALVRAGSSVVVVEHDADVIRAAQHIVDMGPTGGVEGGRVLAEGPSAHVLAHAASVTGQALRATPPEPRGRAMEDVSWLTLRGVRQHNLRDVTLRVPLGRLTVVTGVSGSGKSTLVRSVLLPAVRVGLGLAQDAPPGDHDGLDGVDGVRRAVEIDQSPIGRTPRSVPATYIDVWNVVRELLAGTKEARARGFAATRFSFNTAGGRCETCAGNGSSVAEMSFLPDVVLPCDACGGARFDETTLAVRWRGLSASALLDLDVASAVRVFESVPKVRRPLELLLDLGLGYLRLGQPSHTLSGGEAQRLKLVSELGKAAGTGPTLYVLDEPTTGLHRDDVRRLIDVLQRFVDRGDTVVVIEHHLDLIHAADWAVDLGPEGGEGGGAITFAGTPSALRECVASHTGVALREVSGEAAASPRSPSRSGRKRATSRK
ncbi:MAG: excinuclease ABC subunit UvrA [Sandaracinaceae bacterium]|nr:excinuclease ABC subunit UvrA [Sandaracinaceae bacterium]